MRRISTLALGLAVVTLLVAGCGTVTASNISEDHRYGGSHESIRLTRLNMVVQESKVVIIGEAVNNGRLPYSELEVRFALVDAQGNYGCISDYKSVGYVGIGKTVPFEIEARRPKNGVYTLTSWVRGW